MITVDRALVVLILGVVTQSFLRWRRPAEVWRDNLSAELNIADAMLKMRQGRTDPLLSAALDNLSARRQLVTQQLSDYDALPWFPRALFDVAAFRDHADWIKQWRQEWADKLKSPSGTESGVADVGAGSGREPRIGSSSVPVGVEKDTGPVTQRASRSSVAPERGEHSTAGGQEPSGAAGGLEADEAESASEAAAKAILEAQGITSMDGVVQEVLQMMEAEPGNPLMQERGCESLRYIAVDEESRLAIAAKRGIEVVLQAMRENPNAADVQGYCCGTLTHLAATVGNRATIISLRGLQAVIKAMKTHPSAALVQYKACAALANLAATGEEQAKVASIGGIRVVLKAFSVHLHDATVLGHCFGALYNLAVHAENRANITMANGTKVIQRAMKMHPKAEELQRVGKRMLDLL